MSTYIISKIRGIIYYYLFIIYSSIYCVFPCDSRIPILLCRCSFSHRFCLETTDLHYIIFIVTQLSLHSVHYSVFRFCCMRI